MLMSVDFDVLNFVCKISVKFKDMKLRVWSFSRVSQFCNIVAIVRRPSPDLVAFNKVYSLEAHQSKRLHALLNVYSIPRGVDTQN
jgi:hypothetical protein